MERLPTKVSVILGQLGEIGPMRLHYWTTTITGIGNCSLNIPKHLSHEVSEHCPHVRSIPMVGPSTSTPGVSTHRSICKEKTINDPIVVLVQCDFIFILLIVYTYI